MNISVIIPTYNREGQLLDLVQYLDQRLGFHDEIIVVDQSDSHESNKRELNQYSNLTYCFGHEKGTGKARNFGATHTQAEWLCFLDDDVRPAIGFFDEALGFLDRNDWIDVLQPELFQRDVWNQYHFSPHEWMQSYHCTNNKSREIPVRSLDAVQWFLQKPSSSLETLSLAIGSGAFFIRRESFVSVGGFDENLSGSGDDREMIMRLWWYGYRTYFYPKIVAFHLHEERGGLRSGKTKDAVSNMIRPEPDPGQIYFYKKWFPGYPTVCFYLYYLLKHKDYFLLPLRILRLIRAAALANQLLKRGPQYCLGVQPSHRTSLVETK